VALVSPDVSRWLTARSRGAGTCVFIPDCGGTLFEPRALCAGREPGAGGDENQARERTDGQVFAEQAGAEGQGDHRHGVGDQ